MTIAIDGTVGNMQAGVTLVSRNGMGQIQTMEKELGGTTAVAQEVSPQIFEFWVGGHPAAYAGQPSKIP